jgi:hypothetical protein
MEYLRYGRNIADLQLPNTNLNMLVLLSTKDADVPDVLGHFIFLIL